MSASSTASERRICIFFDCRVAGDGRGYEEFRQTVYAQCRQLLTLSHLHYHRSGTTLSVTVHLVMHTHVESFATPVCATSTGHPIDSGAAGVISGLRALAAAQPDHSVNARGAAIFGNRMGSVLPHVQRALGDSQQRHQLILFCSSYVSHAEATQSLSGLCLYASPHQRLRCILVDWEAVCVTVGELTSNVRVYRCSRSARQLQAAMQDILSLFLLPDVRPSRRLGLQLGLQAVPVIATIWHYGAFLDGRDTIGSVLVTDRALSAAAPLASGVMHQRLTETNHRHDRATAASVVERGGRDPWSTLHLRAVLEVDDIDESLLMGDTWALSLDTSAASTSALNSSSAPSSPCTVSTVALWHAFCNAFLGDALVLTGEETGIEAHRHAMQRHHHFVAYFMPDRTMRVREIVPPELRFVPLPALPTREGLREEKAYKAEMQCLREQLVSHCASASFSLDALLSSGWCGAVSTP
ncbi:conserved hypothetical protein [Leishmania mexicana MHOM/GT/2001/U1103]|uniref:Uncharacterized protein n=1 Tax=Leishmania mexicana (strain MHOM/GT/2001/U1103) TaxID=929439 RepID=E9AWI2_LEIMU|nr:conserved hypothetical protein [Leishmania mexicana MHOM/GT/2001/U1103]CBZ27318.1 conserved hypothetical protein [Leishmania mexicana MHOM/GT/2001/U1103]